MRSILVALALFVAVTIPCFGYVLMILHGQAIQFIVFLCIVELG